MGRRIRGVAACFLMLGGKGVRRLYLQKKPPGIPKSQKRTRFKANESLDKRIDYPTDSIRDECVK
jgi:hypothetical protein